MIVGHTKFAPDRFFGMVKKNYKRTFVSTLDDIQNVVKKSMLSGQNIPQGTKTTEGRRLVTWYDWKSMFSVNFKSIPNITCYHHFRFDHKFPGKVFVQELVNSPELEITILSTIIDPRILPEELVPKGMDINRRWYLFEEVAKFCSSPETANITCPRPEQPKPSSIARSQDKDPVTASGLANQVKVVKRKRTCSHCHCEGHTKTKKGKITCPQLI